MKLEILKNTANREVNKYVLTLNWMEGDADGYQETEISVKEDDYEKIEEVKNMFHEIIELVKKGRDFDEHPYYDKYFTEDVDENTYKLFDKYFSADSDEQCMEHPLDCNYYTTRLEDFELNYYDKDGVKFTVIVKE